MKLPYSFFKSEKRADDYTLKLKVVVVVGHTKKEDIHKPCGQFRVHTFLTRPFWTILNY